MKSKKSTKTYGSNHTAQILDILLNSALGQELSGILSSILAKTLGVKVGSHEHDELLQHAKEAAENYKRQAGRGNPYKTLHVDPDAPQEVVKAAWRSLSGKHHPDSNKEPDEQKMKKINVAYERICREKKWSK